MWRCPSCGRRFASTGQTHTCRRLGSLDAHLVGLDDEVRQTFDRFVTIVEALGPVEILAQKTRIAFHARMTFAVLVPRRQWLAGHLVLARVAENPRFTQVSTYSPRNHVHEFRLDRPGDIDAPFEQRIAEAYRVGLQEHHHRRAT